MLEKLIVMLTHNDVTVKNALDVFSECCDLPVSNWGFKDVGLPPHEMKTLCRLMKSKGKTTFLEVVTYSEEDCMHGAKLAAECGFDYLLGTIYYDSVNTFIKTTSLKYCPFVGDVSGSPSILQGTLNDMLAQEKAFKESGAFGTDLLGYRYADGDPEQLSRAFINTGGLPCVLAGSIASPKKLDAVKDINPWRFTMGSALFKKSFIPDGSFRENLEYVIEYIK